MIDTIEHRLEAAKARADFITALAKAAGAFETYREFMPQIPGSYSRTLLHKNAAFEIVSMRWEPGSTTPIHDHGDSNCWVVMLEGEFDVDSYERDDDGGEIARIRKTDSARVVRGDVDYRLGWRELHRVTNNGSLPAYTVQLYFSPIHDYVTLDEHTGIVRKALAQYDALYDLDLTLA